MAITKPAVKPTWADTAANPADIVMPPDATILAGWPESATPPARQYFNAILNYLWNAVRYFSRRSIADWDAAETYQNGDIVRGGDNYIHNSYQSNNTNQQPSSAALTVWGPPSVKTAVADSANALIANTAYVIGQISVTSPSMNGTAAVGVTFKFARADHVHPSDTSKANTNGNYPNLTVGSATNASNVPWTGVSAKPTSVVAAGFVDAIHTGNIGSQSVNYANSAGLAYPRRSDGAAINFIWSGQGGQPTWLVGGSDGVNFYVWNPANFSVNYATSAGSATNATHASNADFAAQGTRPAGESSGYLATTAFVNRGSSYGYSGYRLLPDGGLEQWGITTWGNLNGGFGTNAQNVTFPISFPNACINLTFGKAGSSSASMASASALPTQFGFTMYNEETSSVNQGTHYIMWSAKGY